MAISAELVAKLGLDPTSFQRGLANANTSVERFKGMMRKADLGGGLSRVLGAGALVQGFRAVLQRAQEARDAARDLGKEVDAGTASVARYADHWDRIKTSIGDAAVVGLSFITRTGEALGNVIGNKISRAQGMSPEAMSAMDEAARTAPARRAAMQAAARQQELADGQAMKETAKAMNEGSERRLQAAFEALPVEKQIAELEQRRVELQRDYADQQRSALVRARAFNDLTKTEVQLGKLRNAQADQLRSREAALAQLRAQYAQIGETDEDQIVRLRKEATTELEKSNNLALTAVQRADLRLTAQQKLNQALEQEVRLRMRDSTSNPAASKGPAIDPNNLRNPLGVKGDHKYGRNENATPKTMWDLQYGPAIAARNASLKAEYGTWGPVTAGMNRPSAPSEDKSNWSEKMAKSAADLSKAATVLENAFRGEAVQ